MLMRLDRPAAAEFYFFLAMPTMVAAFGYELMQVKDQLSPDRAAVCRVGRGGQAVPVFRAAIGVCAVRLVPHRRRGGAAGALSGRVTSYAVAAKPVHYWVLRDGPAGHQRGGDRLDLRYH
jgi:hypothetical protein